MKKICLTGGGTAGHIMPNIALFEYAKDEFEFMYIGAKGSMEEKLITPLMPFFSAPMVKLVRSFTLKNFKIPFVLLNSVLKIKKILKEQKPDIIFSKGGFVSVPVAIAGFILKIPVITHESDLTLGLANKIISKFSKKICTSFEETALSLKKGVFTGTAIRKCFENPNKSMAKTQLKNFDENKKTILIIGGSLGSKNLNCAILTALNSLKEYNVVHIVGKNNLKPNIKQSNYYQIEFAENIADFFDLADLIITRGGSNCLFEIAYMNKKMIIIPLSKQQSRGDQIENANLFKKKNLAEVILEEDLTTTKLVNAINNCINKNFNYLNIKNGTQNILNVIKSYIK